MNPDFIPIIGSPLQLADNTYIFKGGKTTDTQQPGTETPLMGLYLTKQVFSGGKISAKFKFKQIGGRQCADIIVYYDPSNSNTLNAGVPPDASFLCIRAYDGNKWSYISQAGDHSTIQADKQYEIEVSMLGSTISLRCNGVEAVRTVLPRQYPPSQIGLFFISESDIEMSEFVATTRRPRAFVISQFSSPYNEVYMEVIKSVCSDLGVEVIRADEAQGPGLIIADVISAINDSSFVIADISPVNANVFYELGYANGVKKPAILVAERTTKLPFDVSPFRTLFYDNTIAGKPRLEKGLREAIKSVLGSSQ